MNKCFSLLPITFILLASSAHGEERIALGDSGLLTRPGSDAVLVKADSYAEIEKLPAELMTMAEAAYRRRDYGEAASDLQTAARIFRFNSADDGVEESMRAESSAAHLDRVATEVKHNEIKNQNELRRQLAEEMYNKSRHDRLRAVREWSAKQIRRAGYDLKASADEIEKAALWSDEKGRGAGDKTIQTAREMGDKLAAGTGWTAVEVGKALDSLGSTVQRIGKLVLPPRDTLAAPKQFEPPTVDDKVSK